MRIKTSIFWKFTGLLGTSLARCWINTVDYKLAFYDPNLDPAMGPQRFILLFWHEHILCPLILRRHSNVTMLLSRHGDAEIVGQVAKYLGMICIRGSTFQGGSRAVKEFLAIKDCGILAFTPDGPRGPRRTLAQGPVFLASKLQIPIVLLGIGYDRPWRANSWDRFAIPRPFSRGRVIASPPLHVPNDMEKTDLEHFRQKIEFLLNDLTNEAEAWAESGEKFLGESIVCMGPKSSLMYYGYNKQAAVARKE